MTISYEDVLREYAEALEKDALTDTEKKQAFLDALLDDKRIEPFATLMDMEIEALEELSRRARPFEQRMREMARCNG